MTETEIKLAVENLPAVRRKLLGLGWQAMGRRQSEKNTLYDRPDRSLSSAGYLLRVRVVEDRCWLTVKLPPQRHSPLVQPSKLLLVSSADTS